MNKYQRIKDAILSNPKSNDSKDLCFFINELREIVSIPPCGIELIANELERKAEKHGYDDQFIKDNPQYYEDCELAQVASVLISIQGDMTFHESDLELMPESWDDEDEKRKMMLRPYKQRLIIAGALIVNELNRINP